jgi:UDP-glucuronate 4-epimerase
MSTSPKTHVVTGGVGFIGYHVTKQLLLRGERVVVIDDFSAAPYPVEAKRKNQQDLLAEFGERVRVITADVSDQGALKSAFAAAGTIGSVVHLAGIAGVRPSFSDPARYVRVNAEGTANVFQLCQAAGVKQLLFASSSSVYGNSTPLPATEDAPAVLPESPYAASKRSAELLAISLSRMAPGMAIRALRFFTVYGPRQRPEMAIASFTRASLAGEPITMFGDGSMRRDFTHVEDTARGVLAALDRMTPGYRVYNLGSGNPIELRALIDAIGKATGRPLEVRSTPVPLGDVDATFADISRAREELGWQPQVDLVAGLKGVVAWLRD